MRSRYCAGPHFLVLLQCVHICSCLAGAAENVHQLVADQLLDIGPGGLEILTGVKLIGMLLHKLTDGARHGQAQVGVNVDLADGQLCGLPQLILRVRRWRWAFCRHAR